MAYIIIYWFITDDSYVQVLNSYYYVLQITVML